MKLSLSDITFIYKGVDKTQGARLIDYTRNSFLQDVEYYRFDLVRHIDLTQAIVHGINEFAIHNIHMGDDGKLEAGCDIEEIVKKRDWGAGDMIYDSSPMEAICEYAVQ